MTKHKIEVKVRLPEKRQTVQLLVRVDPELHAQAEELRKRLGHKWTEIVESALKSYVETYSDRT